MVKIKVKIQTLNFLKFSKRDVKKIHSLFFLHIY